MTSCDRAAFGTRVAISETGAARNSILADLVAGGLGGVRPVTSDTPAGLVEEIAALCPRRPGSGLASTAWRTSCAFAASACGKG